MAVLHAVPRDPVAADVHQEYSHWSVHVAVVLLQQSRDTWPVVTLSPHLVVLLIPRLAAQLRVPELPLVLAIHLYTCT